MYSLQKGDATKLPSTGKTLLIHVCNNRGGWGKGFVLALSKLTTKPERAYRSIPRHELKLGSVQFVKVDDQLTVANMIAQNGYISSENPHPLQMDALRNCLKKVAKRADQFDTIQLPKVGSGLAGGDWSKIEPMIQCELQHFQGKIRVFYF